MKERLSTLPGLSWQMVRHILTGTYHSIFLQILRGQGDRRQILSNEKHKHTILKIIMKEMNLSDAYEPETLVALLSHYKNKMLQVSDLPDKSPVDKEIKSILQTYEQRKRENNYMDFDDILLDAYHLLKNHPGLLHTLQRRFQFILCDEWQDTNPIQYELIKMLAAPQNNLFVVGDDDQTIFEFNGADSSIILNFSKNYQETKTYYLNVNYRSTTSIVGLANTIISFNKNRYEKKLDATMESTLDPFFIRPSTADEEATVIIENILSAVHRGQRNFKDFAILYRNNSNNRAIFDELVFRGIPFVTFGTSNTFYEHGLIKPVIDHLRMAVDGRNLDAVKGILPTLYLNREKTGLFIEERDLFHPAKNLLIHALEIPHLKEFQKKQIRQRIQLIEKINRKKPVKAIRAIRQVYDKYMETDERKHVTTHKEIMREMLAELESSARRFETVPEFLRFVDVIIERNKEMEKLRKNPEANVVKLMTIHKAKGLEFPVVYLLGASETILPHKSAIEANGREDTIFNDREKSNPAIEEERRLVYVAVTRAKEELYISSPVEYRGEKLKVSRFLQEAFTDPEAERDQSVWRRAGSNSKQQQGEKRLVESILVWDCTNPKCHAWMRIDSYEDSLLEGKPCPLCNEKMEQSIKDIYC
jgi:DNA helicase-2/ATP-dependent DNA helicase PcrA